jgi:hypothetical protein
MNTLPTPATPATPKREPMFVRTTMSNANIVDIALVSALLAKVLFVNNSQSRRELRAVLMQLVKALYPNADVYVGHTHYRVLLDGTSFGPSVYVDCDGGAA